MHSHLFHVFTMFPSNLMQIRHTSHTRRQLFFTKRDLMLVTLSLTLSISTTFKSRISNFLLRTFLWWSSRGVNRLKIRQLWLLPHMMGVITPKVSVISSWFDDWLKRKRIIIIRVNIQLCQIRHFPQKCYNWHLIFLPTRSHSQCQVDDVVRMPCIDCNVQKDIPHQVVEVCKWACHHFCTRPACSSCGSLQITCDKFYQTPRMSCHH